MAADHVEGLAELVEIAPEAGETLLDVLGASLDLEPAQAEHDYPQIGVEAVG